MERLPLLGGELKQDDVDDSDTDLVQMLLTRHDFRLLATIDSVELVPLVVSKLYHLPPRLRVAACIHLVQRDPDCRLHQVIRELCEDLSPDVAIRAVLLNTLQVRGQWFRLCAWLSSGVEAWLAIEAIVAMNRVLSSVTSSNKEVFFNSLRSALEFTTSTFLAITCAETLFNNSCKVDPVHIVRVFTALDDDELVTASCLAIANMCSGFHALLRQHWRCFVPHANNKERVRNAKFSVLRAIIPFFEDGDDVDEMVNACHDPWLLVDLAIRIPRLKQSVATIISKAPGSVASPLLKLGTLDCSIQRLIDEFLSFPETRDDIMTCLISDSRDNAVAEIVRLGSGDLSNSDQLLLIVACVWLINRAGNRHAEVAKWRLSEMSRHVELPAWLREVSGNPSLLGVPVIAINRQAVSNTITEPVAATAQIAPTPVNELLDDFFATEVTVVRPEVRTNLDISSFPTVQQRLTTLTDLDIHPQLLTVSSSLSDGYVPTCRVLSVLQANLGIG